VPSSPRRVGEQLAADRGPGALGAGGREYRIDGLAGHARLDERRAYVTLGEQRGQPLDVRRRRLGRGGDAWTAATSIP
jgi:hypothetical protein